MTFLRSNLIRQKSGFYTNGMVTPCPLATIQPLMLIPGRHFCIEFTQQIVYYRPQRSCGQGNIFTPVCHSFCSQGGSASVHAGIPPPRPGRPPQTRLTPPRDQADPPGTRQTPLDQADPPGPGRHPPGTRQTPPGPGRPHRDQADPPNQADSPGPGRPSRTRQIPHPDQADTPPGKQTPAYGLRAAGTHPTGMHSCSDLVNDKKSP